MARKQRVVLAGDAWIADGNYHETLDLRLELADRVVVLDTPWWKCSGHALVRGFRRPGELPDGCDYPRWMRLRDEWHLAGRIWRKRHVEPAARTRGDLAAQITGGRCTCSRSKQAVADFIDRVDVVEGDPRSR